MIPKKYYEDLFVFVKNDSKASFEALNMNKIWW